MSSSRAATQPTPSHHFQLFGLSQLLIAVIASVTWMAISSGLIMLNKELLSNGFPYPMALSGLGTAIASAGEVNLNLLGVLIMMSSEAFESVRLVLTQLLLTGYRFHPIEGLMYLAPACTFWLMLGSLSLEYRRMVSANVLEVVMMSPLKFLCAAAMGFAVNALAYIVIQVASSLTLKVLGTVKNALVVVLGILILQETVTPLQGVGYGLSLAAFFWYNLIKSGQIAKRITVPEK